jgi:hypothetical protein
MLSAVRSAFARLQNETAMPSSPRRTRAALGLFAAAVLACPSCSSDGGLSPVAGKVMVNGKPAAGARVIFLPEGATDMNVVAPYGTAKDDGSFTLTTGDKPGAKPGKYVVTVVWPDPAKKPSETQKMMGMAPDAPDLLGGRYATKEASKLRSEVKPGENKLDTFDLK